MGNEKETSTKKNTLSTEVGAGYGQTNVLYSSPAFFGKANIKFETESNNKGYYEQIECIAGKDIFQGRFECGAFFKDNKKTKYSLGIFGSNDFKAPEFIALDINSINPNEICNKKHGIVSGLLRFGITADIEKELTKNISAFVKADMSNNSYSCNKECVYPYQTININHIRPEESSYTLNKDYRYEKGSYSWAASIKAGIKAKIGQFKIKAEGGVDGTQPVLMGTVSYNIGKIWNK